MYLAIKYVKMSYSREKSMKKYCIILSLLCIVFLSACSSTTTMDRLQTPINLSVNKNVLTFDPVFDAEKYIINANSVNIEVYDTTYTFTEEGTYNVRVQAISTDHLDSLFSQSIKVDVKYLTYPEDIDITNNLIDFEREDFVDNYLVEINGTLYETLSDIMPYLLPGSYDVRIKAVSDTYIDSEFSPLKKIILEESAKLNTEHIYTYSKNSSFDLPLYTYQENYVKTYEFEYIITTVDQNEERITKISASNLYIIDNTVYLTHKFIQSLNNELQNKETIDFEFVLKTNLGDHLITLKETAEERPYVFSDKEVKTNFYHDVTFGFELFGYEFVEILGHGITVDDYDFIDNQLTIKQSFITEAFKSDFSKNELTFTYKIGESFMGHLKITK